MPVDYERARLIPRAVFAAPRAVLACADLTREQKVDVLLRWAYDAAQLGVAREEGMAGEEQDLQGQILSALASLQADPDTEWTGPTTQHGVPSP